MKPVKLGIIGCGLAARHLHWPVLQKLSDKFEIQSVCNNNKPKAESFAHLVGDVPYVLDYHDLLQNSEIEAVDITLPIHLNYQVTKDALHAGKHVIVEKPLAADLEDAKKMLRFANEFPYIMMVAENYYYHPVFLELKTIIHEGMIGTPYAVSWDIFRYVDSDNKYAKTEWRIHHQYPGGFITDGGIHNIAALHFLFGKIVSGNAFTKSINPEIGEIDSFSFQFETESGVSGTLKIFLSVPGIVENRMLILGEDGSIIVEDAKKITVKKRDRVELEKTFADTSYQAEFEDFYHAIRTGKPVNSTFAKAYRDLEVLFSALDSAKNSVAMNIER